MNMVAPDAGKLALLYWLFGSDGSDLPDMTIHGFKNDYTPVNGSLLANFIESDFPGYSALAILRANFGAPFLVANVAYIEQSVAPLFDCSGGTGQNMYGWYLTEDVDDTVVLAQRFDTPRNMTNGSQESIDPFRIGLQTLH